MINDFGDSMTHNPYQTELKSEINRLRLRADTLEIRNNELKSSLDNALAEINQLRAENEKLKRKNKKLKKRLKAEENEALDRFKDIKESQAN